ncbi:MAG: hypothetical protein ABF241_10785 [Yoonia sp.]
MAEQWTLDWIDAARQGETTKHSLIGSEITELSVIADLTELTNLGLNGATVTVQTPISGLRDKR